MNNCTKCNSQVGIYHIFCRQCGQRVGFRCTCGAVCAPEDRFCWKCGQKHEAMETSLSPDVKCRSDENDIIAEAEEDGRLFRRNRAKLDQTDIDDLFNNQEM